MRKALINLTFGQIFRRAGLGLRLPDGIMTIAPQSSPQASPQASSQAYPQLSPQISPEGSEPTVYFHRWRDFLFILFSPELKFADAFANGHIEIENGRIYDVIIALAGITHKAFIFKGARFWHAISGVFLSWAEGWSPRQSKNNVHAHYDLGNDLYQLFLDTDMQYSCAYFTHHHASLEDAQAHKKQHIINKLLLKPGMTCLDIGSGWGGLSFDLARHGGKVTGLTLSEE